MTKSEAIANLNHIYGIVSPDIQRSIDLAIKALEERPQGEWIIDKGEYIDNQIYKTAFRCSLCCGKFNSSYNYCPNCGAKMKGGAE